MAEDAFDGCDVTIVYGVVPEEKYFTYTTSDDNEVTITSFDGSCGIKAVIIPNTLGGNKVTAIGAWAFGGCSDLTSIIIPDGVTTIEYAAFDGCSSLTSIIIPDSVTTIADIAFKGCSSLTSIIISDGVTCIGDGAFGNCSSLTNITIPNSVTSVGAVAFSDCSSLTTITIPNSVTNIGEFAFDGCSNLLSLTIPDSITTIEKGILYDCSKIASVNLPDSVTSIGECAFYNCSSLTSITIPDSVTSIGEGAFENCSGLTSITIPDGVTSIDEYAFESCKNLTSITIPDSVTSIGEGAFENCSGLTGITIPDGVTSIDEYAFRFCSNLTSITIPDSVTSIGAEAFICCTGLTAVRLPMETAISIDSQAFAGCTGLNGSTIFAGEGSIVAEDAFAGCDIALIIGVPEGYPAIVPEMIQAEPTTLTIFDYWSGDGARSPNPTEKQKLTYAYRDWIEATYNVKIQQIQGGDWGSCAEKMINFVSAPDGSLRAYIIEPGKVSSLVTNGVAASWGNYNLSGSKWNKAVVDAYTINGQAYGVSTGAHEPRELLYFNKRVLEEAGIDWSTIYDMQAAGTWTWDAFENLLKKVQKDTDNDGVNDIWGLVGSSDDLYCMAVFTNGGSFFDFDASGKLQPTVNSEETLESLNWARDIYNTYWMPTPDGANWDWYKDAWEDGNVGFYMYQAYGGFNDNAEMADMEDEWGAVAFPVAHAGGTYLTMISEKTTLIPNVYDAATVQKIAFFIDLWTNDTPGVDTSGSWIGNKYSYTDTRAVKETYGMLRQDSHGIFNKVLLLGTQNDILGNSLLWSLGSSTPAELVEAGMPAWQAYCDSFNANLK